MFGTEMLGSGFGGVCLHNIILAVLEAETSVIEGNTGPDQRQSA